MKNRSDIVYLLAVGFISILGQVVMLRELNVAFYGIELIYILSFAFWLLGTGIGAAIGRRGYIPKEKTIHIFFLLSALLLIGDIVFVRGIRNIFGGVPGGYLPFTTQISGLIIALFPAGLLAGILFQWTAKRFVASGDTLAKAYAIESAGGIIGALASTVFLDIGISNFSTAVICCLGLVLIVLYYSLLLQNNILTTLSMTAATVFLFVLVFSAPTDLTMTSWDHPYLIESMDTPYNRVTITAPEKQINVFEDDVLSYESQSLSAEEFVHLSTLQTTNLNNILVLGGGYAGIIYELLKLPVKKIDYVEINRDLIEILKTHLPVKYSYALQDKKVNIIYDDPGRFLQETHIYDIIFVGMPEPMSAQANRFYTKEFFTRCKNSLDQNGICAFKIQSSENIWTDQLIKRNAGIYNALKTAFGNEIVLPGAVNIFIASDSELTNDTELLISRFKERNPECSLVSPQYINYIYTNDRYGEIRNLLSTGSHYVNSDFHPVCYSYTISLWLSKFFPGIIFPDDLFPGIDRPWESVWLYVFILLIVALLFMIRKSQSAKRISLVFTAGFTGMVLEIILILLYQNKNGILYRDIGLLIMAFMAGLAAGSYLIDRLFIPLKGQIAAQKSAGKLLFIKFTILILIIYLLIEADLISSLVIISFALLADGIMVAGIFGFVSLHGISDQQVVIPQLYTADLIGGCIGSLAASLVLIPVFGFFVTLIILSGILLGCIILQEFHLPARLANKQATGL